jgi:cobalt-zinc-cadmium efflux system protein
VAGTLLLRRKPPASSNPAAYFHLLSDAVSSFALILGAVAILRWIFMGGSYLTIAILFILLKSIEILWNL